MKICAATTSDIPLILPLIQEFFPYVEMDADELQKRILSKKFWVQKIENEQGILGYAEWEIIDNVKKIVRLNGIAVISSQRGKGYATLLLKEGETLAREKKMKMITLLVKAKNVRAKKLYRENGYAFNKIHLKKIEGELAEEWAKAI